jgi:hypothetical protein
VSFVASAFTTTDGVSRSAPLHRYAKLAGRPHPCDANHRTWDYHAVTRHRRRGTPNGGSCLSKFVDQTPLRSH